MESRGSLLLQDDALMYYGTTMNELRRIWMKGEESSIGYSDRLGGVQLTCLQYGDRHGHTSRRGRAFQLFLSPMRSMRLAGIQYTGSRSSNPGYPSRERPATPNNMGNQSVIS